MERNNAWTVYDETQTEDLEKLCRDYRVFLDEGKTERECIQQIIRLAENAGYVDLDIVIKEKRQLKAGDKLYRICMKKSAILFHIGTGDLEDGLNILGAHIDSPRIDVKQNPLYEDTELAYLDTHYYGGIKKYQWVTLPLALHGVVVKKDGSVIDIVIGEKEEDPVFCISDLLVHLSQKQLEKKAKEVIDGEDLNLLIGNKPLAKSELKENEKEAVKANILKLLKDTYGIEEEDFLSAELEIVPAGRARECGLDRSMIFGYGQDDRVCAYTSLVSILESKTAKRTGCCLLVDKEEIGSVGATGMQSRFFENSVAELMNAMGIYSELSMRRALANSRMLSSDVSAAYDPIYASAFEKKNASYFAKGLVFNKFTGSRGKSGSNDANAEYLALVRDIMDSAKVPFQTAELGKVDLGGGGTIAYILSLYGMDVIDCGVAVMSMHAPWEVTSKADIYAAKLGYDAFLAR